ncbi:MAG TPA: hypothetical protein VFV08_14375 [Puia sp.]|nr:hypothetical protein [Puia sp.]
MGVTTVQGQGKGWWYSITPFGRTAIVLTGTVISVAVGISIWNKIKKDKAIAAQLDEAKKNAAAVTGLANKGLGPTIADNQMEGYAQQLVQAFNGCGTDEQTIYGVIAALANEADLDKLIAVYGARAYDGCMWGTNNYSLSEAMTSELDGAEIAHVNEILASKGITYRF